MYQLSVPFMLDQIELYGTDVFIKKLKEIESPDTVHTMDVNVFYDCSALESVKLSDEMEKLPKNTFWKCTALKEVTIPVSITKFDTLIFLDSAVETIRYEGTAEQWNAIEKAENWDMHMEKYTVICADGTVIK